MLQVSGNTLQQVEKFNYLGGYLRLTKGGVRRLITRIGKANAVLCELYRYVATKRELSNTAKLSVFKLVFVPILTYGHESWVMAERIFKSSASGRDGIFAKSPQCDKGAYRDWWHRGQETSLAPPGSNLRSFGRKCTALKKKTCDIVGTFGCSSVSRPGDCAPLVTPLVWHFATKCVAVKFTELWCRTTSPSWENITTLVWPCIRNAQRKIGETKSCWLNPRKATQMSCKA